MKTIVTVVEHNPDFSVFSSRRVELEGYPLLHDFAFTATHFVLVQNPVEIDALPFVLGLKGPAQCLRESGAPSLIHLVPRERESASGAAPGGEELRSVPAASLFSLHHANAFDDERGRVVIDSVFMESLFAMSAGGIGCGHPCLPA